MQPFKIPWIISNCEAFFWDIFKMSISIQIYLMSYQLLEQKINYLRILVFSKFLVRFYQNSYKWSQILKWILKMSNLELWKIKYLIQIKNKKDVGHRPSDLYIFKIAVFLPNISYISMMSLNSHNLGDLLLNKSGKKLITAIRPPV